ncbi:hypothetical protein V8B55DRAFT_1586848 [Mucor lusitanicus]
MLLLLGYTTLFLRDQDEALMQKVSLVTDLVGKCICMEQQVKDKKKDSTWSGQLGRYNGKLYSEW